MIKTLRASPLVSAFSVCLLLMTKLAAADEPTISNSQRTDPLTKVVFLGTGMAAPNPRRMRPSLAIVVNGKAYLVDAGAGVVRRAAEAYERGEAALGVGVAQSIGAQISPQGFLLAGHVAFLVILHAGALMIGPTFRGRLTMMFGRSS
jgi:hypothetical protein